MSRATRFDLFSAVLGIVVGVITCPLAAVAWPGFLAWYLCHDEEDDEL